MAADNAVEAGIYAVWSGLSTGKIKVFNTLTNWLSEFRLYQRDKEGKVVKKDDHLMDCTRYVEMSGENVQRVAPVASDPLAFLSNYKGNGWMA